MKAGLGAKTEKGITRIFCVISGLVIAFLFVYAFCFSWYNDNNMSEYVTKKQDNLLLNLIGVLAGIFLVWLFTSLAGRYADLKKMDLAAVAVGVICVLIAIFWIQVSQTAPQGDQRSVVDAAVAFANGDTRMLQRGGYIAVHIQQLGLVTFMRALFAVTGQGNYRSFQYLSACMLFVIVWCGYRIIRILTRGQEKMAVKISALYLLLMLLCFPLYGYASFVYGEIISTACVMAAAWTLLALFERFRWYQPILLAVLCGGMVQVRYNTIILAIAFLVVLAVKLLCTQTRWQLLLAAGAIVAGMGVSQLAVRALYAPYMGEDSTAIPAVSYIAMGMHGDPQENPGWFDGYNWGSFIEHEFDVETSSEDAKEQIAAFLEKCKESPGYALAFYTGKTNIQWNVPMYQCIAMNDSFDGDPAQFVYDMYFNGKDKPLEDFMNLYQLMIYGGVLAALLLMQKKWNTIEPYVLMIGVYGGFLFSLLWEAKPRYVFPYFIMMIPYASFGLCTLSERLSDRLRYKHRIASSVASDASSESL